MRLSERLARLEDRAAKHARRWKRKHKEDWKLCLVLGLLAWYFYGMLINSIRLGVSQTFSLGVNPPESIWVVNPFRNFIAILTPTGLGTTAVAALLLCLITKKGYNTFSGYRFIRDKRGFDILPDGTHGTSRFMALKEMRELLEVGKADALDGTIYGKHKDDALGGDEYADYIASDKRSGLNGNILVVGAPGTGKSRGFVRPFVLQCAKRRESVVLTDPKAELYGSMAGYLADQGYEVRVFNLLDMEHSDQWNCIGDADADPMLIPSIASTIINNTSGEKEVNDFWSKAELNLLTALLYYVQFQEDDAKRRLPLRERRLGAVLNLLTESGLAKIDRDLRALPAGHPARTPYGLFLQAKENLRGNIVIGLGNRLNVFQNALVDRLTADSAIDLTLPGQKPCAYFCILSAQDSTYTFLSSLFFTLLFSRLEMFARREGVNGRLPVAVNFCLDEFPNIGKLNDFKRTLSVVRGYKMNCQIICQSVAQLADMYPRHEWEELAGNCDTTIYLGGNDQMTADFISAKCGMTTIRVTNNQMPLTPLFSPVYTSTRPYSQTRSNIQRALMQPDEVLRLDGAKSLVLFRGRLPLLLYKIAPEELAAFGQLRPTPILEYCPPQPPSGAQAWESRAAPTEERARAQKSKPKPCEPTRKPAAQEPRLQLDLDKLAETTSASREAPIPARIMQSVPPSGDGLDMLLQTINKRIPPSASGQNEEEDPIK